MLNIPIAIHFASSQQRLSFGLLLASAILLGTLTGCGGGAGGGDGGESEAAVAPSPSLPVGIGDDQRTAAATSVATTHPDCGAIAPFYWEIGDRNEAKASGSVDVAGQPGWRADTSMGLASASKWLYAGYVAERSAGVPTADDIRFLTFRSGYRSLRVCMPDLSIDGCLAFPPSNGRYSPEDDGLFSYDGGHMQKHASLIGLGESDNAALAAELKSQLGAKLPLAFDFPQPAGGARSTPQGYAAFLRKLLDGSLQLGRLLGTNAVCTNPRTCAQAVNTPVPTTESWHYSLGHWVEDDPLVGDGAFSSAGAFGFYPWIDATRTWYGVVARQVDASNDSPAGAASVSCGRRIRKAWVG